MSIHLFVAFTLMSLWAAWGWWTALKETRVKQSKLSACYGAGYMHALEDTGVPKGEALSRGMDAADSHFESFK